MTLGVPPMRRLLVLLFVVMLGSGSAAWAGAVTVSVDARDDIYAAGDNAVRINDGLPPVGIKVQGGETLRFAVTGKVSLNVGTGDNYNDADGVGAIVAQSFNTGAGAISGMRAPGAGYLMGVFVGADAAAGPRPPSLDFLQQVGTGFQELSPQLNQVFFIGDGLTGDGNGVQQKFHAPAGAQVLYLGISDAGGYVGYPSWYQDNQGTFQVTVSGFGTPWRAWAIAAVVAVAVLVLAVLAYVFQRQSGLGRRAAVGVKPAGGGKAEVLGEAGVFVCRLIYELTILQRGAALQGANVDEKIFRLIHWLSRWGVKGVSDAEVVAQLKSHAQGDEVLEKLTGQLLEDAPRN